MRERASGIFETRRGLRRVEERIAAVFGAAQHFDFVIGEQGLVTQELGYERDFGVVLDDFHALEGGEEIRAESYDAVIGHEDGFVIGGEGLEDVG